MTKRKYQTSEKKESNNEETPKKQLAGSPYDKSQESTVRSRKAHKSKLAEVLSPLRQPQAIIGEGIISNNNHA